MNYLKHQLLDKTAFLGIKGDKDMLGRKADEIVLKHKELRANAKGYKDDKKILLDALIILYFES